MLHSRFAMYEEEKTVGAKNMPENFLFLLLLKGDMGEKEWGGGGGGASKYLKREEKEKEKSSHLSFTL